METVKRLDVEHIAAQVCREVAELPDRSSPKDWPEAMLVTHDELSAIVRAVLARVAAAPAAVQPPTDDALWDKTLEERDRYHDMADRLADAIARHFGIDIGEHTAGAGANDPWENALTHIEDATAAAVQPVAQQQPSVHQVVGSGLPSQAVRTGEESGDA